VLSRQVARHDVTISGFLPGRFETARLRGNFACAAEQALDEEIEGALHTIPAGRLGRPDEFGSACAFLCSSQAGHIMG
jgi:3-oxoacyl-[acyl-carrier protein] reductase